LLDPEDGRVKFGLACLFDTRIFLLVRGIPGLIGRKEEDNGFDWLREECEELKLG